jgi:hypothetical protein
MKLADVNTLFGFWPKRNLDLSLKKLLEEMDRHEVTAALTCSIRGILYNHEEGNEETLRECRCDSRLLPAATIDPRRYPGGKGYVKALAEQGFRALRLFPDQQSWPIAFAPFRAIAQEAAAARLPVLVSNRGLGSLTEIGDLFSGAGIPVILMRVNYDAVSEALAVAAKNPSVHVETSLVDTPDGFKVYVQVIGADRLLFGSYAPYHYLGSAAKTLTNAEITDAAREQIARSNFMRLFGRPS